ncbi:KilA-N domain-containing protein [Fulvivirgaceae bacterium BMA12]|uniref:KilA-N domain-containing protein n=1 Tax=Agaribacillus aureus TaxID=3051825 RepID=A0ABT8LDK1_9BACT|nr:KilA-N domain-containing protein [Fulvivirgaceae bacterium BMA12]
MVKTKKIEVENKVISIIEKNDNDYFSLTDMLKQKDGGVLVSKWLSNKNTIDFLGVWERLYNTNFNYTEFGIIMSEAGVNRFTLSVKQWIERTNAIGIMAKAGRYGGTYAHKDIAFELGSWISPEFKLLLIREFQRLKEAESNQYNLEWNVKRILTKTNYQFQTDAIKQHIIPENNYSKDSEWLVYAEEADLLNVALFNCTAKDWKEANPKHVKKGMNIRDFASINELVVLSNLENINALLIAQKMEKKERFDQLKLMANYQLNTLANKDHLKSVRKLSDNTFLDLKNLKE